MYMTTGLNLSRVFNVKGHCLSYSMNLIPPDGQRFHIYLLKLFFRTTTFVLFCPQPSFIWTVQRNSCGSGVRNSHTDEEHIKEEMKDTKGCVIVLDQVVSAQKMWIKVIFLWKSHTKYLFSYITFYLKLTDCTTKVKKKNSIY